MAMVFAQTLLATDLQVDLSYFNLSKATNRTVYGYLQTVPNVSGSSVVIGQRVIYTSDSSGIFYVSNCVAPGLYRFDVQAPPLASSFLVYISATNLGLISASSNLAVSGSATYPPGAVAWSASTSDSRFVKTPTNSATASDGQVISKTGNDTKWVTGGGAGSQTPWEQNINGAGYSLSNVLNLRATNITSRYFTNSGDARIDGDTIIAGTATIGLANIGAAATIDEDGDAYFPTVSGSGGVITNLTTLGATTVNATRITSTTITNTGDARFNSSLIVEGTATLGLANIGAAATIDEDGDSYFPTIAGDGSGVTNVPSKFVASINVLTNLPAQSNLIVYVESYFGTNTWGGGQFIWEDSSATFNGGTVFVGTSGRWRRINTGYPTNVFFMEWFGVVPNAAIDSYTAAQAAINATPITAGATILPPYNFAVGTTLTYTNRRGSYFGPLTVLKTRTPGARVYPNPVSVIHWMGANGGTNLVAYDVGNCTFTGFGLDTRIGLNNGDQYTNAAGLLMDVDMNSTHTTTTTANVFDGMYFRERHTNTTLVGMRIASYNWQNCEFFQFYDCYFQGSGADIPNYWINTTNVGAAKAIQLGGNGGGANSFGHMMRNCGFNTWQYFVYSAGGSWDIEQNYGTAAGIAAYYLNSDDPSYIRSVRDEGDRQFLVSPSVHPVTMESCIPAGANGLSVPQIPPVDAVNLIAIGNDFQHEANVASITNSVNATGWYFGRQNSFDTTNDAVIASWRFNSSFDSHGDFGTVNANNNIQSGPWKTPSALQATNLVYQSILDSATFPVMTLMSSNGAVAIGGNIANVIAPIWNSDPLNKTSWQIGDAVKNPRVRARTSNPGNVSEFELSGLTSSYFINQSTNARVDVISGNAKNTINFRSGYGEITGTNDVQLAQFGFGGLDYKIKFPYDTNFEVVGPIYANTLRATNHITWFTNNSFSSLSSTPVRYGQVSVVNSNGVLWQVTATTSGTLAWSTTNQLGSGGGGGGSQTPWTSDINAATYKLTNISYASFSGGVVLDKDGAQNNGYVGSVVTAIGGRSNLIRGSASSVDNVVLEGRSNVFNIQSSVAVGNAIIAGSSNLLNNPALATVRNSVILGGHGNNIQGASDALVAGSGSVVQSGHNGTFVLSDSQNTATLSQNSDTLLLRFQNGVGINTNNPGTNALFVIGSQTVSSNLNVSGIISGNGSGITGQYGFGTNTAAASSWTNSGNHNFTGNVTVSGTLQAGSLTSTLGGSVTVFDHTSFAGASSGQVIWDSFGIAGKKVFGIQSQPNDVQQPTNIVFRVDYPISVATNYTASDFVPVTGRIKYCYSNYVIYAVSPTKTNLISDLQ